MREREFRGEKKGKSKGKEKGERKENKRKEKRHYFIVFITPPPQYIPESIKL